LDIRFDVDRETSMKKENVDFVHN